MTTRRAPSPPPEIPGYQYRQLLGSGGFADVFLYEQSLPSRTVAVKVLLPDAMDRNLIEDFRREANMMAQLSSHPSIVTVYGAAVTADGRPYLSMEYCPKPNLGVRYRRERFSVPEVLTLGVQIAGAVETAHRAGVLHRDIKPANILVTAYNRPALTDFGIATTAADHRDGSGMSIPWSPPEAFATPPSGGRESDVFSLAATLYTLLAGRTPFELPGMGNSSLELISRIQSGQIAPLVREDVPASLQSVLWDAMDPDPKRRHASALAFGRALQRIEAELALPLTMLDVLDDSIAEEELDDDDSPTRIRGVVSIDAQQEGAEPARQRVVADEVGPSRPRRTALSIVAALLAVGVVVAIVIAALQSLRDPAPQGDPETTIAVVEQPPPPPIDLSGMRDGEQVVFTWQNAQPEDGDTFVIRFERDGGPVTERSAIASATVPADDEGPTCIEVAVVRENSQQSDFRQGCIDE